MNYKLILHWDKFRKYPSREGNLTEPLDFKAELLSGRRLESVLGIILKRERSEETPRTAPSASAGDIIELEDGRRFVIESLHLYGAFSQVETEDNRKSFLVDQGHGAMTVQFSAWRTLRPNVKGYGMTSEDAIYDLTQKVQPL